MSKTIHASIGHHYIVEASGCDPEIIGSVAKVQQILVKAAEIAGAEVWSVSFSKFPPHGVSGVVVISESHISAHTWPEYGYGALDFYSCGDDVDPEKGIKYAVESFRASCSHITEITRGLEEGDRLFYHSFITWEEDLDQKQKPRGKKTQSPVKK